MQKVLRFVPIVQEFCLDPLSDVLALLRPQSYVSGGYELPTDVAVDFPEHLGIKCYALVSGSCWLSVDGVDDKVLLAAGDCYVLPPRRPFRLAADLSAPAVTFGELKAANRWGAVIPPSTPRGPFLVGGHFALAGNHANLLLQCLPPIIHIRTEPDRATMRWALERMADEVRDPKPGSSMMMQQLALTMLLQAIRLHLAEAERREVGWLFALQDKQISAALQCMHDRPAHAWSLQKLAESVGMSRAAFARRFKEAVGSAPVDYLTRWRMMLAKERLRNSRESISEVAPAVGYDSDGAFGRAFKRVIGCSPKQYSRMSSGLE